MEDSIDITTAQVEAQENVASAYSDDAFLNELVAEMGKYNQDVKKLNSKVGDTGVAPGDSFTLTGELVIAKVKNDKGEVTSVYPAFATSEGKEISVKQFMGISSLVGYVIDNKTEYKHEYDDDDAVHREESITSKVIDGFTGKAGSWYNPTQRVLQDFILYVRRNKSVFANKKATYLGYAIKPYTAKKDGESPFGNDEWKEGYHRVIKQKLWKLAK